MKVSWMDLEKFSILLSCYDWRLKQLPIPKQTLYRYVHLLRERPCHHLRLLKPLGVRFVMALLEDREAARRALAAPLDADAFAAIGLPVTRYLSSMSVLGGGKLVVTWVLPPQGEVADRILAEVERAAERMNGVMRVGDVYPVQNCEGRLYDGVSADAVETHGIRLKMLERVSLGFRVRTPALAYVLVAALDANPLLTMEEMRKAVEAAEAREAGEFELRRKYVLRYYRGLSAAYVLGRVHVARGEHGVPLLVAAPAEAISVLYGLMASTMYGSYVFVSNDLAVAGMTVPLERLREVVSFLLEAGAEVHVKPRTVTWPFPFEMYDPVTNTWGLQPTSFAELIRRVRLVVRGGSGGGSRV